MADQSHRLARAIGAARVANLEANDRPEPWVANAINGGVVRKARGELLGRSLCMMKAHRERPHATKSEEALQHSGRGTEQSPRIPESLKLVPIGGDCGPHQQVRVPADQLGR